MSLLKFARPVLAVVMAAMVVASCGDANEREAKYLKRGEALFERGEYEKARLEFKNAAQIKPTDPEVRYRLGLVDEAEGDLRNAFVNFSHAVEQNAKFYPALLKLANYYFAAEQFGEAESRLNIVLAGEPNSADAHALRAALMLRRQDFDGTEKEARIALAGDPSNIGAYSVLTGLYNAMGDDARSGQILEEGIAKNPKDLSLLILKVNLFEKKNDLTKVAQAYDSIFKLRPDEPSYRAALAEVYIKASRLDDAEATLRAGVDAAPDNWTMKRQLVLFLSDKRGLDPAEKEIKAYMQANPTNDDLYFWLADLYLKHQAADRAVQLLQQVIAKDKTDVGGLNARTSLARISFARGDRTLAEKLLAVVLERDPSNREALFVRAGISFDLGRYQSSVSDLRSILRDDPKNRQAMQLLGEALLRQGHLDLAIDTLSQLVDIDPVNSAARVRLAQMYHLSGDSKRALTMLETVTSGDPNYPVGWESTARIATDTKDWTAANYAISKLDAIEGQKMTATYLAGEVARGNNKYEDAIKQFATVVNANPDTPLAEHALTSMVISYRALGRIESAAHYIETLKTENPIELTVLGECYLELKRPDDADKAFDRAIALKGGRPEPYLDRARLLLTEGKGQEAEELLKAGVAAVPGDLQLPLLLADAEANDGHYADAVTVYEDLLSRNPAMDVAANNLAELIADYQYNDPVALEKARVVADRFQAAQNPLLLDTVGWVYFRLGNMAQAQTFLSRAAAFQNAPAQIHYHYGALLLKQNQQQQAKEQLQIAVKDTRKYPGSDEAKRLLDSL
jgi:tetratricopeptide (TPR) repeat protein